MSQNSEVPPLVSVVVPCYNAERFIGETLESVFTQTYPAIEVIVVDDASTDRSWDLVQRYEGRARLLRQERNRGGSAARNRGASEASGEFLMFLDADDRLSVDAVEHLVPAAGAARAQIRGLIEHAVDALPGDFRVVFMLREIEQCSVEETARLLHLRPETVKTRLHRARRLLRTALQDSVAASLGDAFPFLGLRCERMTETVLARLDPSPPRSP